jgi:7-carboxy-7-deazaguanine synthase
VYAVKELFYTLQGEGFHSGRPAVFCRFAGCNLWSGREADRASAVCTFCDTDFVGVDGDGGGRFQDAGELARAIAKQWPVSEGGSPFVVFTGGEPLLQLDAPLIEAVKAVGFSIAIETNGTLPAPPGIDWICVSPKADAAVVQDHGDELKLVYPQMNVDPARFLSWRFDHFFLQPMDGPEVARATQLTVNYCLAHPRWRLSLQSHKSLGIR